MVAPSKPLLWGGAARVEDLRLGSQQVTAAYLGELQLWPFVPGFAARADSVSDAAAALSVRKAFVGEARSVSTADALLGVRRALQGALQSVSALVGDFIVGRPPVRFTAVAASVSRIDAALAVARSLRATAASRSAMESALAARRGLAAIAAGETSAETVLGVVRGLKGAISSVSSAIGALTVEAGTREIELFDDASSTGTTITAPSGIQAGDFMVLWDAAAHSGDPGAIAPSGFDILATETFVVPPFTVSRVVLSYKLADGSEGGASLSGMAAATINKRLAVFRAAPPFSQLVAAVNSGISASNATPSNVVIEAGDGTPPIIAVAAYSSTGTVDPRGMSPAKDGETGSGTAWLAWKFFPSEPEDVTISMQDEGNLNFLAGGYFEFA